MDIFTSLIETDHIATLALNGTNSLFLDGVVYLYTTIYIWIPCILVLLFILIRNVKRDTLLLVLLMIGLVVLTCDHLSSSIFKPLFERYRPTRDLNLLHLIDTVNGYRGGQYGFFSGHAANSFGLATFLSLLVKNRNMTISMFVWATLNMLTRVYLGVHFVGDILVGMMAGMVIALLYFTIYRLLVRKRIIYQHKESESYTITGFLRSDIASFILTLNLTYMAIIMSAVIIQGVDPM